jgi:exodeoxyribonuclease V beta subunit
LRSASDESPVDFDETGDRDVDGVAGELLPAESARDGVEPLPLSSDRGALFGTLVHAVLEECDFKKARDMDEESWYSDSVTEDIFQSLSRRFYPPDWYRPRSRSLKKMVRCVLRSDIPGPGRLCNLEKQEMRAEVEFLIAVPHSAELVSEQIRAYLAKGFLKGFIDLLLKTDGRWWVVDWKTNVPPGLESAESYDQSTMKEIMDHHHYHLQYELYLLALCATLSGNFKRPVRWETEIGGAAYLFVRGMREEDDRAVFVSKPDRERMLSLASVLGLEGVLV